MATKSSIPRPYHQLTRVELAAVLEQALRDGNSYSTVAIKYPLVEHAIRLLRRF